MNDHAFMLWEELNAWYGLRATIALDAREEEPCSGMCVVIAVERLDHPALAERIEADLHAVPPTHGCSAYLFPAYAVAPRLKYCTRQIRRIERALRNL